MGDERQAFDPSWVTAWRLWVTGRAPQGVQLAAPVFHDVPHVPATTWGPLCRTHACRKQDPLATRSLRFRPSGICVRCWQRWDKRYSERR